MLLWTKTCVTGKEPFLESSGCRLTKNTSKSSHLSKTRANRWPGPGHLPLKDPRREAATASLSLLFVRSRVDMIADGCINNVTRTLPRQRRDLVTSFLQLRCQTLTVAVSASDKAQVCPRSTVCSSRDIQIFQGSLGPHRLATLATVWQRFTTVCLAPELQSQKEVKGSASNSMECTATLEHCISYL